MDQPVRTFLAIVDESAEMPLAIRYAAWRAKQSKGRVALLYVIQPQEIQAWAGVEAKLTEDAQARAKSELKVYEDQVEAICGSKPLLFIKQGDRRAKLMELLDETPEISVLFLAAKTGEGGPGPLISYLTSGKGIKGLKIPLVIVPDTYKLPDDVGPV